MRASATNLGPGPAARRRLAGAGGLVAALGLSAYALATGAGWPLRAATFPSFLLAALGFLQARARVCVVLAARGRCDLDGGPLPVTDAATRGRLRRAGRRILALALLAASAATGLLLLV